MAPDLGFSSVPLTPLFCEVDFPGDVVFWALVELLPELELLVLPLGEIPGA